MKSLRLLAHAALAATALLPLVAGAQDFPTKPIKLLIPFPPGGGTGTVSRVVATRTAPAPPATWPSRRRRRPRRTATRS